MSKFFQQDEEDEEIEEMEKIEEEKAQSKVDEKQKKTKKDKKKKKKQNDLKDFEEELKQVVVQENAPEQQQEQKNEKEPEKEQKDNKEEDDQEEQNNEQDGNNEEKSKAQKKREKKKKQAEKKAQGKDQEEKQPSQSKKQEKEKPMNAIAKLALEKKLQKEAEEQRMKEELERLKREEEERIRKEEEEEKKRQEELERKKNEKKAKIKELKQKGEYLTDKQKKDKEKLDLQRQMMLGTTNPELVQEEAKDEKATNIVYKKKKQKKQQEQELANQEEELRYQQQQAEIEKQQKEAEQRKEVEIKEEKEGLQLMKEKIQQKQVNSDQDDWEALAESDEDKDKEENKQQESKQEEIQQDNKKKDKKTDKISREDEQRQQLDQKLRKELFSQFNSQGDLRSPICCILGHVDTGKTTLLDKIRNTNVQEGEAGGITQQIGATFFPGIKLKEEIAKCNEFFQVQNNIPGLLIIDTPGHESFSNLRSRGSSLCDLAILVIDLMHGLEKQTLESLELLRMRKTPFVIALNKIDRCFEWKKKNMGSSYLQLKHQKQTTRDDYENRKQQLFTQLGEKGFNVVEFWENKDPKTYVSIVPTSGITGEGIPDLLSVIVKYTSQFLKNKIKVNEDNFNCTVLERKEIEGYGATIDCILVDGVLRKNDRIMLQGFKGPITTKIKAILTPHPMKEIRVKGEYLHHDSLFAAMGLKLAATDLDEAVAGSQLYVVNDDSLLQEAQKSLQKDYDDVKNKFQLQPLGVGVAASTLGSLEALLQFLFKSDIPVSYVSVGPVSKDDVMKALKNVVSENVNRRKKEYACMLVFDVKVLPEAKEYAEVNQIKIFEANIIYHLFDQFIQFVKDIQEDRKRTEGKDAIFPCILQPVAFFNKKDPLIMGVDIVQGVLKPGTPIGVYNNDQLKIGVVETIEYNKKSIKEARSATGSVAIRVKTDGNILAGRHFEVTDQFASIISRNSIDMLKKHFKTDLTLDEWALVKELKTFYKIM